MLRFESPNILFGLLLIPLLILLFILLLRWKKKSIQKFGELSVMLSSKHSASVECLEDSQFYKVDQPRQYLESHPELIWHIAQVVSTRLHNLSQYLVDVKRQYGGHDHLDMVDDVLGTLLNQQKTSLTPQRERRRKSNRDMPDY